MAHDTKEANRARQKRHRDKKRAVTLTATGEGVGRQLQAADHCAKCNDLTRRYHRPMVCPEHARAVEVGLAKLGLGENRATHLNTQKIVSGTDIARVSDARAIGHGRTTGVRPPARVDAMPDVLAVQGLRGPGYEELIKTILPWFTDLVAELWDEVLELNPHLSVEDLMSIVPQEAAAALANELQQPKEKQAWHSHQSSSKA